MTHADVVLWTQPGCGPCIAAERMLQAAGVPFVKRPVAEAGDEQIDAWRTRGWGTPIIQAGDYQFQGADPDKISALAVPDWMH